MRKLDDKILQQKNEFGDVNKRQVQSMKDFERVDREKQEGQERINQLVNKKGECGIRLRNSQSLLADLLGRFADLEKGISEPRKKYEAQIRQIESEIQLAENQLISCKEN